MDSNFSKDCRYGQSSDLKRRRREDTEARLGGYETQWNCKSVAFFHKTFSFLFRIMFTTKVGFKQRIRVVLRHPSPHHQSLVTTRV